MQCPQAAGETTASLHLGVASSLALGESQEGVWPWATPVPPPGRGRVQELATGGKTQPFLT